MEFLLTHGLDALAALAYTVFGLLVLARLVAPLTETKLDDKLAGLLSVAYSGLVRLLVGKKLPPAPGPQ